MFRTRTLFRALSTKVRPSAPLFLRKADGKVYVAFSDAQDAIPVGSFPLEHETEFTDAFSTEVDKFEPQPLLTSPSVFQTNPEFWKKAQQVLKEHIHTDPVFAGLAMGESKTPFFHIFDLRNPPPLGRIPEVEDILGTARIEDGKIVPNSFEPNTMYRPVSSYGMMLVSPEMANKLAQHTKK